MSAPKLQPDTGLLLTWPILNRMKQIEGWLAEDEADLLIAATALALTRISDAEAVVEVGSYCGRSTCVIGSVAKAVRPSAKVYAVDPHDGRVGALDQGIKTMAPTPTSSSATSTLPGSRTRLRLSPRLPGKSTGTNPPACFLSTAFTTMRM